MPVWAFVPLFLVAVLACPVSMWIMGWVTHRKMNCGMCLPGAEKKETMADLEARKDAVERDIARVKAQGRQD